MAHTVSAKKVYTGQPIQNVDSSSNVETRGGVFYGEINITSYTSLGEVLNASELGMNEIYNGIAQMSGLQETSPQPSTSTPRERVRRFPARPTSVRFA